MKSCRCAGPARQQDRPGNHPHRAADLLAARRVGVWHSAYVPGCDEGQLTEAETRLGVTLPHALRAMYRAEDGRFNAAGQWWVVWPLERLVSDTLRAWSDGALDRTLLAFGDDGTGNPFCVNSAVESPVIRRSLIGSEVEGELSLDQFEAEWLEG